MDVHIPYPLLRTYLGFCSESYSLQKKLEYVQRGQVSRAAVGFARLTDHLGDVPSDAQLLYVQGSLLPWKDDGFLFGSCVFGRLSFADGFGSTMMPVYLSELFYAQMLKSMLARMIPVVYDMVVVRKSLNQVIMDVGSASLVRPTDVLSLQKWFSDDRGILEVKAARLVPQF